MSKLLAPNGKPSNLTPEQYKLVRTSAFKEWFGDWQNDPENASKVVDENGEPLVMYHGSLTEFNFFDKEYWGYNTFADIKGFFFTNGKEEAEAYMEENVIFGGTNNKIGFLKECFLNLKDPIIQTIWDEDEPSLYIDNQIHLVKYNKGNGLIVKNQDKNWITSVVFEAEQIKLADGTNTTFDGNNPDIRFEEGGILNKLSKENVDININERKFNGITDINYTLGETKAHIQFFGEPMGIEGIPSWAKKEFYIENIYRDNEKGIKGSGLILLKKIIEHAKRNSVDIITLKRAEYSGEKLRNYYTRIGFVDVGEKEPLGMYLDLRINEPLKKIDNIIKEQIKLADGTNTTFDGNNPDIRFMAGGNVEDLISKGIVELKMFDTKPEHAKEYGFDVKKPLYVQSICITESERLKGIGKKVLDYIDEYAVKNGHDLVFGHITQKANFTKDSRHTDLCDIDLIKEFLIKGGYSTIKGNNDFYKVIKTNPDIRYAGGGEVNSNSFMKWYIEWYKGISDKMFIAISLPTIVTPFKEKNVVILDVFEKKDQSIDAKPYLIKIVKKADEYGVVIYLEPNPRHKYFQDNLEKKNKITKEYLIDYYQIFDFELTPNKQFMKRVPHFDKGGLIAPNGKPSNLTPIQYKLVRTPEFKAWFGDWENDPANASKVVDENGEPLIVFHGSPNDFSVFDEYKIGSRTRFKGLRNGIYFSSKIYSAKTFGEKIYEVFLNLKNPHIIDLVDGKNITNAERELRDIEWATVRFEDKYSKGFIVKNTNDTLSQYDDLEIIDIFIVNNPNQIKLADGTNTTFDGNNPDIRFDGGGKVKKPKFDIDDDDDEERVTISIKGIGEVILSVTYPEYEFIDDIDENTLEELGVDEGDMIGKIEHLEIEDEYKGQGYAKLLMKKAKEVAKEKGLMPLYLNASPMGSKRYGFDVDDLTRFYESLGFEVFLRQGGNNLMILKDTYEKGGETKNKIMEKQMKINFDNNYAEGGEASFENAGTSMVMYHEKKGDFIVPKGQVYLWLYDVEGSADKLQKEEFDWVFYPYANISMGFQKGFIPPLKRIWTKKFQKDNKGSEHLLGVIKAYLIDKENGQKELYVDMMSVNPTKQKKGIMSYMIKELRDTFNLTQDQVTFSKLTPEGEKFVNKGKYEEGGSIGFIPMDLEEDLMITAKWGGTNIKGVIGFLNAMIDSGLTDSDLLSNPSKNTRFQRERAEEKKIQEIWNIIEPNYKGGLKGNMYYSTIKRLVQRANSGDDILKRFKPFRKLQKDSYADGGGVGKPYDSMTKYQIEKEYKKLNEKRDLLKNKYRDFKSDEILENEKEIDKIITLLYGKDFSGIGQKFRYADGGWVLVDADTERKLGEYETESEARKMMYEYEGNSEIVEKSVFNKLPPNRNRHSPAYNFADGGFVGSKVRIKNLRGGYNNYKIIGYNEMYKKYTLKDLEKDLTTSATTKELKNEFEFVDKYADGGYVRGDEVLFKNNGKSIRGTINDVLGNGKYGVFSGSGFGLSLSLVHQRDIEGYAPAKEKRKFLGIFNDGGAIPNKDKMFHLPLEMVVYVPSTQDVDNVISVDKMVERVDEVKKYLASKFGGYTASDRLGGFVDSRGKLVNEDVVQVTSFSTIEAYEEHKEELIQQLSKWGKEWGQESIGFEFEGDLLYVPQELKNDSEIAKFRRGGFIYEVQKKGSPSNDMRETLFTAKNLTTLKDKIIEKYGTSEGFIVRRRTEQGYYVPVKFENGGEA